MGEIVPAIIAKNQSELNTKLNKVKNKTRLIHLDVMDGVFVKNSSLNFDFKLPEKLTYEAHLMVNNPLEWVEKHGSKVNTVIFHVESCDNVERLINKVKGLGLKVGVALNPETPVEKIERVLDSVDKVLIMTVKPGRYGGEFIPQVLSKVVHLSSLHPNTVIEVDGGINPETILKAKMSGAEFFVSGSYVVLSKNSLKAINKLRESLSKKVGVVELLGFKLDYSNSGFNYQKVLTTGRKALPEVKRLLGVVGQGYSRDWRSSINLVDDSELLSDVEKVVSKIKKLKADLLIVVGIGGSSLGAKAVLEAVQGVLRNHFQKVRVFFVDTVDSHYVNQVIKIIGRKKFVLTVVSKSGTTLETVTNFKLFSELLKKNVKNWSEHVVIISGEGSELWRIGEENGFHTLRIPEKVGGRFSVLSPVGLFPLMFAGVNVRELLRGAKTMRDACLTTQVERNPAIISAVIHFLSWNKGVNITNHFFYGKRFKSLGEWVNQLFAESLGKNGKGLTPISSIGSVDHHSMIQLFLGGPRDKLTTFIEFNDQKTSAYGFNKLLTLIFQGTEKAYVKKKLPFLELFFESSDEFSVGQFLQFKMIEVMILGELLKVNAFNQPNVELYKKETKKLLEE